MAANQREKHKCPPIDAAFSVKITGPAYREGMSTAEARAAWNSWLRVLRASVRPMARKTY